MVITGSWKWPIFETGKKFSGHGAIFMRAGTDEVVAAADRTKSLSSEWSHSYGVWVVPILKWGRKRSLLEIVDCIDV